MLNLAGKGALVIGTKRVGQLVTRRLAMEAANLAIAYRSSGVEADALHQAISGKVERSCLIQADLSLEDDVRRLVEVTCEQLGDLSFVINLASGFPRTPFHSLDGEAWDSSLATAKGSYLLTVNAAHHMMGNAGPTRGHIVLFSDWAASQTPYRDYLPYLTAKAAIDFMTRGFAVELAPHGILVNAIAPGPTMRPDEISREVWQQDVLGQTPLKRESSAEEIAELIVMLLKSETITGETIRVDAGRHLAGPGAPG